ncbi:MAG: hypothetical protein E7633_06000 [Ruminococcaceae bacterium]|nr:hypothetical protein [Oscillospiraceae bacterium]
MKKLIICLSVIAIFELFLPIYVELFESPAGKEAWYFTMFLTINPIISALLGFVSGFDVKKLWFVPFFNALAFPICFWLSTLEIDFDIFSYLIIYLPAGLCAMVITHCANRLIKNKKR